MGRKEDMGQLVKVGFLREKKNKTLNIRTRKGEASKKEIQNLMSAKKVIFKGYGYVVVSRKKTK